MSTPVAQTDDDNIIDQVCMMSKRMQGSKGTLVIVKGCDFQLFGYTTNIMVFF